MEFLNPLFLTAAAAVAVPLFVHLLHLRAGRRHAFPALRYLRRTERDHARRIRLRQLLLLLVRIAAILLLVTAGARLFLPGPGEDHEPTALAVVLDNSLSSAAILGEERMIDVLKRTALESVDAASDEDRIWVLRAGEPWEVPTPGGPAEARRRIEETTVRGSSGALARSVARARSLVAAAGMPAAEVHLLSDLQRSALPDTAERPTADGEIPTLVLAPPGDAAPNRYVASVEVGGGLPPLANERTDVAVSVEVDGVPAEAPPDTARVRLVLEERTEAAADAVPGATVLLSAGPFAPGQRVSGRVEVDPDELSADDRRHFAFRVREPPGVAVTGEPEEGGRFLGEALGVLEESGRIRRADTDGADVVVAPSAAGIDELARGTAVLILAPRDPALLPATNRGLEAAEIPWRLEADPAQGEVGVRSGSVPVDLGGIRIRRSYRLVPPGDVPPAIAYAETEAGDPWLVAGEAGGRPYLLLASPLDPEATTLPLSAAMVPLTEWMISGWSPTFRAGSSSTVGEAFPVPAEATAVRTPDGTLHRVDGRQPFRATGAPGIYDVLRDDSVVSRVAANPPVGESLLERIDHGELEDRLGAPVAIVEDPPAWSSRIFQRRRGREPWRPLVLAALLLLVGEGLLAGGGRPGRAETTTRPERPEGEESDERVPLG